MLTTETLAPTALDLTHIRAQFPSLAQTVNGHPAVFLDGPGGTQVPQRVIDAISNYLRRDNANTGGAYATSRHTDAMLADARAAMADFLHCGADEVVFRPQHDDAHLRHVPRDWPRPGPATKSWSRASITTPTFLRG
jgi:selenocysteine lyase/cysteine desulfurase